MCLWPSSPASEVNAFHAGAVHGDAALRDIPAILVTSRASPEDLQRGRDVGAHGHIASSPWT
jgi:CheY-like chemotaxis protein